MRIHIDNNRLYYCELERADRVASIVLSMPDVSYFYRFICADDGDKRDLVKAMAKKISQNKNDRTCLLVAHYVAMHYKWIDADSLRATYAAIKGENAVLAFGFNLATTRGQKKSCS